MAPGTHAVASYLRGRAWIWDEQAVVSARVTLHVGCERHVAVHARDLALMLVVRSGRLSPVWSMALVAQRVAVMPQRTRVPFMAVDACDISLGHGAREKRDVLEVLVSHAPVGVVRLR